MNDRPYFDPDPRAPQDWIRQRPNGHSDDAEIDTNALRDAMDVNAWAALDIPPEPRLLGNLVTPPPGCSWLAAPGSARHWSPMRWLRVWRPGGAFSTGPAIARRAG